MWHGMAYPEGHDKCGWRWFIDGRFSVAAAHRPLPMAKGMPKDNDLLNLDSKKKKEFSLENDKISDSRSTVDWETKKVRFKEGEGDDGDVLIDMVVDLDPQPKVSWKQMLLGKGNPGQEEGYAKVDSVEYLEFLERDIKKSMVNGVTSQKSG
ncbi:hypothetical protein Golax_019651 [Gossypium laxum]|uniref:Uncharacterized protein n=1 Tax=Gossypium laxum TaxID=34288 RepID=A0A7J8Z761_9ROSI|nr:hypothetical protein [Gossypium laxum]